MVLVGRMVAGIGVGWLVKKGKSKKADKTLHRLRKDYTEEEIKEELNDIEFTVLNSNNSLRDAFSDIFRWRILERYRYCWELYCKRNVIMYYSTSIFCSIDVSSYAATAIVGVVNFLTTLITLFIVDKLGHFVSILAAGLLIYIFNVDEEREEEERQVVGYFVALLIVLFVSFFASTWGFWELCGCYGNPITSRFCTKDGRCCCPWSNACRVRTAQEEDTVAIVGIKNENKDDTSDEAEDEENESGTDKRYRCS
uniref:Major facilitator superfamily (MFS) profile domain-containing protein n=1 Tax=Amphimedon queenslandica TaxID=400682 RepID=A0A1X7TVG9_AMPQE